MQRDLIAMLNGKYYYWCCQGRHSASSDPTLDDSLRECGTFESMLLDAILVSEMCLLNTLQTGAFKLLKLIFSGFKQYK
jgi:hypothetical protein